MMLKERENEPQHWHLCGNPLSEFQPYAFPRRSSCGHLSRNHTQPKRKTQSVQEALGEEPYTCQASFEEDAVGLKIFQMTNLDLLDTFMDARKKMFQSVINQKRDFGLFVFQNLLLKFRRLVFFFLS